MLSIPVNVSSIAVHVSSIAVHVGPNAVHVSSITVVVGLVVALGRGGLLLHQCQVEFLVGSMILSTILLAEKNQ